MCQVFQSRNSRKWFKLGADDIFGPFDSQAQAEKFVPTTKKRGYKPDRAWGFQHNQIPRYRRPGR